MDGIDGLDVVKQIWDAARVAGPFGAMLMFYMWRLSDKERREGQKKYDELAASTLAAISGVKEALRDVNMLLAGRKPHG